MKTGFKNLIRFTQDYDNKEEIILRDHLAMERTKLANERTLLSYIRTSLYLLLGGVGMLGLNDFQDIRWLGYVSLALSAILIVVGIYRYVMLNRHLLEFYTATELEKQKQA
jgi:putative membrane protein